MALVMCPLCTDEEDVDLVERLPDGRKRVICRRCDYTWDHGEPKAAEKPSVTSSVLLHQRFPKPEDVQPEAHELAERLKAEFLATVRREPDPKVAPYWAKYQ